jgi:hypothetical protein
MRETRECFGIWNTDTILHDLFHRGHGRFPFATNGPARKYLLAMGSTIGLKRRPYAMVSSNVIRRALAGRRQAPCCSRSFSGRAATAHQATRRRYVCGDGDHSFCRSDGALPVRWMPLRPAKVFGRPAAFVYKNKDK